MSADSQHHNSSTATITSRGTARMDVGALIHNIACAGLVQVRAVVSASAYTSHEEFMCSLVRTWTNLYHERLVLVHVRAAGKSEARFYIFF